MIIRWLDVLAKNNFRVEHRKGKKHGNADALSRASHYSEPKESRNNIHDDDNVELAQIFSLPFCMNTNTNKTQRCRCAQAILNGENRDIIAAIESDNESNDQRIDFSDSLATVEEWFTKGPGKKRDHRGKGREVLKYFDLFPLLQKVKGKIFLKSKDHTGKELLRLCVPEAKQAQLIKRTHAMAHLGTEKSIIY